ncbi:MAG: radical SAM protein [Planctomycetota bacterium]|nr:radical SAM protein [Planctomycetota bacterium]
MPVLRTRRFLRVKLDMVGRCQLRCVMCHFAHPEFRENPATMGRTLLEKVADDLFPRAHDVVLSSSAEPLLAPELPRALELCREHEVPSFHFSTNAINLTRGIVDKVIDVQMPVITISVDGGTKETFEAIRTPMKWDMLMRRFDQLAAIKEERGSAVPVVSVTAVIMRRNIREMPGLVRLMHAKGVERMNFVHMAVMGGLGVEHESLINEPKLCNDVLEEVRRTADEVGMQVVTPLPIPEDIADEDEVIDAERSDEGGGTALTGPESNGTDVAAYMNHKLREFMLAAPEKEHHNRACYFPWFYIHVNPDGTVFPCGCWFEFSTFGDFRTQDFREIWTGEPYKELRRQIATMELRDVCANCSVANMGRPDVKASFSQRAKIKREWRDQAAAGEGAGLDAGHRELRA